MASTRHRQDTEDEAVYDEDTLPALVSPHEKEQGPPLVRGLRELAAGYDVFLFDSMGTLHNG